MNVFEINTSDLGGGAANVAYRLKQALTRRGHAVSLFVKDRRSYDPDVHSIRTPGLLTTLLKNITGKDFGATLHNRIRPLLANDIEWFNTWALRKAVKNQKPSIIHCHNLHGNYFNITELASLAKKAPVIWTLHDMWALTPHCAHTTRSTTTDGFFDCESRTAYQNIAWPNEKHLRKIKRGAYRESTFHIVTPCQWLKEKVSQSVLRDHNISVIYNGVDEKMYIPQDKKMAREALGLPQDAFIILYVATIGQSNEKGWNIVEDLKKHYRDNTNIFFLSIGGRASTQSEQERTVPHLTNPKVVAQYYSATDIFLSPSPKETFPLTILEAFACGTPVIARDTGGVKEAFEHGTHGWLIPHEARFEVYAKAIETARAMTETDRSAMSKRCRQIILDQFTETRMVNDYEKLYNELTDVHR